MLQIQASGIDPGKGTRSLQLGDAPGRYGFSILAGIEERTGHRDGEGDGALFNSPTRLSVDADGNVWVADTGNHCIRRISPDGRTATVAGAPGLSGGRDGLGALARFNSPSAIVVNAENDLFIADTENQTIRKVTRDGLVTTYVGVTEPFKARAFPPGEIPIQEVRLGSPSALALDLEGTLYIADSWIGGVIRVSPAGSAKLVWSGDLSIGGIAADGNGALFLTLRNAVYRLHQDGSLVLFAGSETESGFNDGPGTEARFRTPRGMARDSAGNLFVADSTYGLIRQVSPDGVVTTIGGNTFLSGGPVGVGSSVRFDVPSGIALDPSGALYVSSLGSHLIQKGLKLASDRIDVLKQPISLEISVGKKATLSVFAAKAGAGALRFQWSKEGTPLAAATGPTLSLQPARTSDSGTYTVTVSDEFSQAVSRPAQILVHPTRTYNFVTLAGSPGARGKNDGLGTAARFDTPSALAVDTLGTLFVADSTNHSIRRISANGEVVTWAGVPGEKGTNDGPGQAARFNAPLGVAVDTSGRVFVSDTGNHTIRIIHPDRTVTTWAGAPGLPGDLDGITPIDGAAEAARFNLPAGLILNKEGVLFIADSGNDAIRRITRDGVVSTWIARWKDGVFSDVHFNRPTSLSLNSAGALFIVNQGSFIWRVSSDRRLGRLCGPQRFAESIGDWLLEKGGGIATDAEGNLYVSDQSSHTIQQVTLSRLSNAPSDRVFMALLGGFPHAQGTNDGLGDGANFTTPTAIATDSAGVLYIADSSNHTIRMGLPAPRIVSHPQDQLVLVGGDCVLGVSAIGAGSTDYQWYRDGVPLRSATNATLRLARVQPSNEGSYTVTVTDAIGTTTSHAAIVEVESAFSLLSPALPESGAVKSSSWGDATGDGAIELVTANISGGLVYLNQNSGQAFTNLPRPLLKDQGSSFVWGDMDNDGNLDLFGLGETSSRATNRFFLRNEGNGSFRALAGALSEGEAQIGVAAAWGDYDGDGWIDLFVAGGGTADCLYHNEQDLTFSRATNSGVKFTVSNSRACVWGDIDHDGWIDLIVMARPNTLVYRNLGGGRFESVINHGIGSGSFAATCTLGDYDNDGHLDLFVCNTSIQNSLYRNLGDGRFTPVEASSSLEDGIDWTSATWGDYNNDGWLDLFVGSDSQTNGLFRNSPGGLFSRVRTGALAKSTEGTGATFADFNNDGALDLFVSERDFYRHLYQNQGNSNSWLAVICQGRVSNRDGIGARVTATALIDGTEQRQVRLISGGEGRGGQNGLRAHFGLGDSDRVLSLRVDWPSGLVTELCDLPVNRYQKVEEPLDLHFSSRGGGRIEVSPKTNQYLSGMVVTLTASPKSSNQRFVAWNDGLQERIRDIVLSSSNLSYEAVFTNDTPREERVLPQWQKSYGGALDDHLSTVEITSDGGMLVAGSSRSSLGGNLNVPHSGVLEDYVALRLDPEGEILWQSSWGGEHEDHLQAARQAPDGGFILAGHSNSRRSGSKEADQIGGFDLWVVRVGADGHKLWERVYGGSGDEVLGALETTPDGGFILAAASTSGISGQKTSPNLGATNVWIIRADPLGNLLWEQTLGGSGSDTPSALALTSDGGILVGATSSSPRSGSKRVAHFGGTDYWLVRLDAQGRHRWQRSFGGNADDLLSQLIPTAGGGFLVGGTSSSPANGNKTSANRGGTDGWVLRVDAQGQPVQERVLGGDEMDGVQSLLSFADGGWAALCVTRSDAGAEKPDGSYGQQDFWLWREDAHGKGMWSKAYGGPGNDVPAVLRRIDDQSFAIAGSSDSVIGGNKTSPHFGGTDYWIIREAWLESGLGAPSILVNGNSPRNGMFSTPATNIVKIKLRTSFLGEPMYYTLDGSLPDFTSIRADDLTELQLEQSATLQAVVYSPFDGLPQYSEVVRIEFVELFSITDRTPGGGQLELDPPQGPYLRGSRVKLTARPFAGWSFMRWEGDVSGGTPEQLLEIDGAKTVIARFGTSLLPLSIPAENNSIHVSPPLELHAFGSQVRLIAQPGPDRCFQRWFSPSSGSQTNPLTLEIATPNRRINAYFVPVPTHTVTLTPLILGQGTVLSNPSTNCYPRGSQVSLTAIADPGWMFKKWEGDLASSSSPAQLVLETSKVVTARFEPISVTNQPLLIALELPVEGSRFLEPGPLVLKAKLLTPASELTSLEFLAGTQSLVVLRSPPYEFRWTNAPPGPKELRAVAVNGAGISATSTPVRIQVDPAPPKLEWEYGRYETEEPTTNLVVRVIKRGNGSAVVNYASVDGTATSSALAFRDYNRVSGTLHFSPQDSFKELNLSILDDFFVEPAESFTLRLSDPGEDAQLGEQTETSVVIRANDAGLDTNSLLQLSFPCPIGLRADLSVQLGGAEGRGQWRFPWEAVWRPSGQWATGLQTGGWPIEFLALPGYTEPFAELVTVGGSEDRVILQRGYSGTNTPSQASWLRLDLEPAEHAFQFSWRIWGQTAWHPTGDRIEVAPGRYIIEFQSSSLDFSVPPNLLTETFLNSESQASAVFVAATPPAPGAFPPEIIGTLDDLEGGLDLPEIRKPYVYSGQLVSDAGSASGFAVTKQVVLTAAHAVFHDATRSIVTNVLWFPRRHGGDYYPNPLLPRGIILLTNYVELRRAELDAGTLPGVAGAKSQLLDVAALWFDTPVICGEGAGGCLVSAPGVTNYLQPGGNTLFLGYPIQGTPFPGFLQGRVIDHLDATPLSPLDERVWTTPRFRSLPGISGGPVCQPARPNPTSKPTYYPAGILLGDDNGRSRIRRIDTEVLQLINVARSAAQQGSNFSSGGVINVALFGGTNSTRTVEVTVNLRPPVAIQSGAAWRFETEPDASFRTTNSSPFVLRAGNFNLVFRPAEGFQVLSNYPLALSGLSGLKAIRIEASYAPRISLLLLPSESRLQVTAPPGMSYRVESSSVLNDPPVWEPFHTNFARTPQWQVELPNPPAGSTKFFRATYLPTAE